MYRKQSVSSLLMALASAFFLQSASAQSPAQRVVSPAPPAEVATPQPESPATPEVTAPEVTAPAAEAPAVEAVAPAAPSAETATPAVAVPEVVTSIPEAPAAAPVEPSSTPEPLTPEVAPPAVVEPTQAEKRAPENFEVPLSETMLETVEASAVQESTDIGEILARVFDTHPQVAQAVSELEATGYAISGAKAGYYPFLQVQASVADKSSNGNTTLSIVQPLWDGGLTSAQVDEARQRQAAALGHLTAVRLELSNDVLSASFDMVDADAQILLTDRYIDDLKRSLQTIERRADNGVAPGADVQTAAVRLAQAQSSRETIRARRIGARSRLSSLMSEPPPARIGWPDEKARLQPADIDRLTANLASHPTMVEGDLAIRIQKAVAKASSASLWPQISLQHRQQLDGTRFDPSNDATLLVAQYQTTNGVRAYQGAQAEKARVTAAERQLDTTRAELQAQFRSDTALLLTYATQIVSQERAANASTNLVDSYRRQFDVGRKTWVEVLNVQREAHESRIQLANLRRGYWQTNLKLILQSLQWERLGLSGYLTPTIEQSGPQAKEATK